MYDTYLTAAELAARRRTSRKSVWEHARQGILPQPIKISPNCTRWRLSEVLEYEERYVRLNSANPPRELEALAEGGVK